MSGAPSRPPLRALGAIAAAGLLLLTAGVVAWRLWPAEFSFRETSIESLVAQVRSWGNWAVLGSIALMIAHSFLPFPAEIVTIANGMVFGPLWGSLITWVGAMLGASGTFALVRLLGRPFVNRMLSDPQARKLSEWSATRGGMALLIGRLIPVIAFNLLNYAAALTHISWWTFLWATGLGILPLTVLLNVFGSSVLSMTAWNWIWLLLGAAVLLAWVLERRRACAPGKQQAGG